MRTKFNNGLPFVIPCGKTKIKTIVPVQAWKLYNGGLFKDSLNTACCLFQAHNILILSAKYGLLKLNDMVLPYDKKMNGSEPEPIELKKYYHCLPKTYQNRLKGHGIDILKRTDSKKNLFFMRGRLKLLRINKQHKFNIHNLKNGRMGNEI